MKGVPTKPSQYLDRKAQVEAVLKLIEDGDSEQGACKQIGINRATFRSAALRYNSGDSYARACEALARDQVEKIETAIKEMRDGTLPVDQARLEIDARKWTASKLFRPAWGDAVRTELTGQGGGPIALTAIPIDALTEEQRRALASIKLPGE